MSAVPRVHLNLGQMAVSDSPAQLVTTLGSCVSVCLFAPDLGIGGMTHYSLPRAERGSVAQDRLRYGDTAIPTLIDELCQLASCKPRQLVAKIVGGAASKGNIAAGIAAGRANIEMAHATLKRYGIRVAGEHTGDECGRRVIFHVPDGRLQVERIISQTAAAAARRRVLIVDDSLTVRTMLSAILAEDPELQVAATAATPSEAMALLQKQRFDVVTLDVHMPEMDGLTLLSRYLPTHPIPTVMISSINATESDIVLRALETGAVDYIQKPSSTDLREAGQLIREKVRAAAAARVRAAPPPAAAPAKSRGGLAPGEQLDPGTLLAIGASTGGPEAIRRVLLGLPAGIPPTVMVLHIPPVFSAAFAARLNDQCAFQVREARDGDWVEKGLALLAPGGRHMRVVKVPGGYRVKVDDGPKVSGHKPSVDALFDSVADAAGRRAVGVILTGMGTDGAQGLARMHTKGARTIGQDEASCVVYGMPREAARIGAVDRVLALDDIAPALISWLRRGGRAAS